ncbi:threonine dehydratase biosynthetic, chloroplastic-like protein, partial [Tanacetum coccineum]
DMFEEKRSILEPAGALALAGAEAYCRFYNLKDANVIVITSGANMNFDRLRFVAELANISRQQEVVLTTFMPEEPGSIKLFFNLVGPLKQYIHSIVINGDNSVGVHTKNELQAMMDRMKLFQPETIEFTNNDLVKDHLRHLMGGQSDVKNELLCRFIFPERPKALLKFLDGESGANVLVGIQVPSIELNEFRNIAKNLRYEYEIESDNIGFQLLMR